MSERPLKILHIIETLGMGGAERILATNMNFIDKERFSNEILSIYSDGDSQVIHDALKGVVVKKIHPRFKHDILGISALIIRYIRGNHIDIVHTHGPISNVYGRVIGRFMGCRVVNTAHGLFYEINASTSGAKRIFLRLKLFLMRIIDIATLFLCTDRLIVVSEFLREYMVKNTLYFRKKIKTIYNSVDLDYFKEMPQGTILTKRNELGIADNEKVILTVGRNIPEKGQRYAIEALKYLLDFGVKARLIIVGYGSMREVLEELAEESGIGNKVIFISNEKDIRILLQMCDVFIFTSLYEGLGIAQIEAMAMKKLVIAFEIGPTREIIKEGISGFLVEKGNSKKLAETLRFIIKDPIMMENMGMVGRRIAEEKFDIRKNIKLLEGIYEEICGDNNRYRS